MKTKKQPICRHANLHHVSKWKQVECTDCNCRWAENSRLPHVERFMHDLKLKQVVPPTSSPSRPHVRQ